MRQMQLETDAMWKVFQLCLSVRLQNSGLLDLSRIYDHPNSSTYFWLRLLCRWNHLSMLPHESPWSDQVPYWESGCYYQYPFRCFRGQCSSCGCLHRGIRSVDDVEEASFLWNMTIPKVLGALKPANTGSFCWPVLFWASSQCIFACYEGDERWWVSGQFWHRRPCSSSYKNEDNEQYSSHVVLFCPLSAMFKTLWLLARELFSIFWTEPL